MSMPLLFPTAGGLTFDHDVSSPLPQQEGFGHRSSDHDLAWQHALEEARQTDFSSWFKPWAPEVGADVDLSDAVALPPGAIITHPMSTAPSAVEDAHAGRAKGVSHAISNGCGDHGAAPPNSLNTKDGEPTSESQKPSLTTASSRQPDTVDSLGHALIRYLTEKVHGAVVLAPQAAGAEIDGLLTVLPLTQVAQSGLANVDAGNSLTATDLSTPLALHVPLQSTEAIPAMISVPSRCDEHSMFGERLEAGFADRVAKAQARTLNNGCEPDIRCPIRLYVEWSDQGVLIWIGADANSKLRLTELTEQVQQWLANHGERLLMLVCNGHTVWRIGMPEALDRPIRAFKPPASAVEAYTKSSLHFPTIPLNHDQQEAP